MQLLGKIGTDGGIIGQGDWRSTVLLGREGFAKPEPRFGALVGEGISSALRAADAGSAALLLHGDERRAAGLVVVRWLGAASCAP